MTQARGTPYRQDPMISGFIHEDEWVDAQAMGHTTFDIEYYRTTDTNTTVDPSGLDIGGFNGHLLVDSEAYLDPSSYLSVADDQVMST